MNPRDQLAARIASWTGLDVSRGGRASTLERVIEQRTRALGHASTESYVASLTSADAPEVRALIDALTVGYTWFYRDDEQGAVFVDVMRAQRADPLHVWVAGTSTGEEAYTIALLAHAAKRRASVLGTDINAGALAIAAAGEYGAWSLREVPPAVRATFVPTSNAQWIVPQQVRDAVRFERHNLQGAPQTRDGGWHMILCRNVLIYFQRDAAAKTIARLAESLAPDGWLFLGASEVLAAAPPGFVVGRVGSRFGIRRGARGEVSAAPPPAPPPSAPTSVPPAENVTDVLESALASVERGDATSAIAAVQRALAIDPLAADAHLVLGIALYTSNEPARALEQLRAALFLEPDTWTASFYLARSYEKLGRFADARSEFENALRGGAKPPRLRTLRAWQSEMLTLASMRVGARR
jgi:chemotaxis protein methyltransferase CheR